MERNVAVLIDGDNVSPVYFQSVKNEAGRLGRVSIFRVYTSMNAPVAKGWNKVSGKYGIVSMPQVSYIGNKSMVDPSLIIDAMDILYTKNITTICLVSSDSDFTKLVNRLRESNLEVVGMGETKVHESLVQACDEFKFLDLIYDVYEEAKGAIEDDSANLPTIHEVVTVIEELLDDEWENLADIGNKLKKQIPGFDVRNYGYSNMTQLIQKNSSLIEIMIKVACDGIHKVVYAKRKGGGVID